MRITAYLLAEHDASPEQVAIVRERWPDGLTVSEETCLEAIRIGLDLDWAAEHLLSETADAAYAEATAAAHAARSYHRWHGRNGG